MKSTTPGREEQPETAFGMTHDSRTMQPAYFKNFHPKQTGNFAKVMGDTEICRKVLEKILDVPIRKVEYANFRNELFAEYGLF